MCGNITVFGHTCISERSCFFFNNFYSLDLENKDWNEYRRIKIKNVNKIKLKLLEELYNKRKAYISFSTTSYKIDVLNFNYITTDLPFDYLEKLLETFYNVSVYYFNI